VAVKRLSLWSATALATAQAANAQVATNITPDTAAATTLGTVVTHAGATHVVDGGTLKGTNLFHSFQNFDLGQGETAQWVYTAGDANSITNVVNRVTGGSPSSIFGMLDSTAIPNADFYFINPAGIVFGEGAQVNVPAAAHFSTASELHFADGKTMSIATPSGSILSVSAPEAFGFLGNEGDISLTNIENLSGSTFLAKAGPLSLSAANISLDNAFIGSRELDLTAVGDAPLQVGVEGGWTDGAAQGRIELAGSWLQTWPGDCFDACLGTEGHISLYGGDLAIENSGIVADFDSAVDDGGVSYVELLGEDSVSIQGSSVLADGYGTAQAGSLIVDSGGDVSLSDSILLTYTAGSGDAGAIVVHGANVDIDQTFVNSDSYGSGNAGAVGIAADDTLTLRNGSSVGSSANDEGDAGIVQLEAPTVLVDGGSSVSTSSFTDATAGDVIIDADELTVTGISSIGSSSFGQGDGGNIIISANRLTLGESSSISSDANGDGNAGFIDFEVADQLEISGNAYVSSDSGAFGSPDAVGSSGDIFVKAGSLLLDTGGILSRAFASGNSGSINIEVNDDLTVNAGGISSNARLGNAGSVSISAETGTFNFASISSDAFGGNGGDITIDIAGDLEMTESLITTNAGQDFDSSDTGNGGDIAITADSLSMEDSSIASRAIGQGTGGTIEIALTGPLTMLGSNIYTDTYGEGDAGNISISALHAALDFSSISSDSFGAGLGGIITLAIEDDLSATNFAYISADSGGSGDAGDIDVSAGSLHFDDGAYISSDALGSGEGGLTSVTVGGELSLSGGAYISSDSLETGAAGGVFVSAGSLQLHDGSISSDAYGDGDAGLTFVEGDELAMDGDSFISSDALGNGLGGNVVIGFGDIRVTGPANITANSKGDGDSGFVDITADSLALEDGATISSSSFGAGNAGGVFVEGGDVSLNASSIISDAHASGDAGGVFFEVNNLTLIDSMLRSEAASTGFGGSIDIEADGEVSLLNSAIETNANGIGDAGDIEVSSVNLKLSGASIISSDALSADGGESGFVQLSAGDIAIRDGSRISTGSANENPAGFIDVAADSLLVDGHGTAISSENTSESGGDAGSIGISVRNATISEGGRVTTNSLNGAAGDIDFAMPTDGLLTLIGANEPGVIETSSGPGTGGIITIGTPLAIISHGGVISALGDAGGANVRIDTPYFIASSDRLNIVAVNGSLTFSNGIYDVSAGTSDVDLSMLDASSVLQGQCSSVHATGRVSQLNIRPSGPFASSDWSTLEPAKSGAAAGGCQ